MTRKMFAERRCARCEERPPDNDGRFCQVCVDEIVKTASKELNQEWFDMLEVGMLVSNPQFGQGRVTALNPETLRVKTDFIMGWIDAGGVYPVKK